MSKSPWPQCYLTILYGYKKQKQAPKSIKEMILLTVILFYAFQAEQVAHEFLVIRK